jgi:hypothetical protein
VEAGVAVGCTEAGQKCRKGLIFLSLRTFDALFGAMEENAVFDGRVDAFPEGQRGTFRKADAVRKNQERDDNGDQFYPPTQNPIHCANSPKKNALQILIE